jgi:hypothetical protein
VKDLLLFVVIVHPREGDLLAGVDAVDAQSQVVRAGGLADIAHLRGSVRFGVQFVGVDDVIAHTGRVARRGDSSGGWIT